MEKRKTAVGLRYDQKKDFAPVVVAKGLGIVAENIIGVAKESNIPVYEDETLANQLSSLQIGFQIPYDLYEVVAQVLIFISHVDKGKSNE